MAKFCEGCGNQLTASEWNVNCLELQFDEERFGLCRACQDELNQLQGNKHGGTRAGAGRKKKKSSEKKQVKSFTLGMDAREALKNLEVLLGAKSQSQVVEWLAVQAMEKYDNCPAGERPVLN